jgi:hypothetical protein
MLIDAVKKHGTDWVAVAPLVPGRTGRQCRDRWVQTLHPATGNRESMEARRRRNANRCGEESWQTRVGRSCCDGSHPNESAVLDVEFVVDVVDDVQESSFRTRERLSGLLRLPFVCADSTAGCCFTLAFIGTGTSRNTGCACGGVRLPEVTGGHSLLAFAALAFRETLRRLRRFMS